MIDELVLEQLLDELGREVAVPADGAERVVHELAAAAGSPRRPSPRITRALMVAAVIAVVAGIGLLMRGSSTDHAVNTAGSAPKSRSLTSPPTTPAPDLGRSLEAALPAFPGNDGQQRVHGSAGLPGAKGAAGPAGAQGAVGLSPAGTPATNAANQGPQGAVDGAKIVKTATLDLQVPKGRLRPSVNRVTGVAVGLGGYVADSKTDYEADAATGQITIRVPAGNFETATNRLDSLPGVRVLGDSENGTDVTAQYTDLQAQLNAATTERDSLLSVLAQASTIGDILAVHDRVAAVNAQIDQLQGQINVLSDQASYSSIAITLTERHVVKPKAAAVAVAKPPTGLAKAWKDARQGFSNSIEWLIARSGGALIVLLAALALIFGIRYLYPVVRRALL